MKQGPNPKRHRGGRSNGRRHQHGLSSNYESNGPDVKIKGSASQVQDRYQALARDALASGDRIAAESYMQHAEHYQRIINAHLANAAANAQNAADANGSGRGGEGRHRDGSDPRQGGRGRNRGAPIPAATPTADGPTPQAAPRPKPAQTEDGSESSEGVIAS